jgi:hypothetical protein
MKNGLKGLQARHFRLVARNPAGREKESSFAHTKAF